MKLAATAFRGFFWDFLSLGVAKDPSFLCPLDRLRRLRGSHIPLSYEQEIW